MNEPNKLKVQFLDVGQGDGIFIEFPGDGANGQGTTMLVDLGTSNGRTMGKDGRVEFEIDEFNRTYDHIHKYFTGTTDGKPNTKFHKDEMHEHANDVPLDILLITHADIDHYNLIRYFTEENESGVTSKVKYLIYADELKNYNQTFKNRVRELQEKGCIVASKSTEIPGSLAGIDTGGVSVHFYSWNAPATTKVNKKGHVKNTKSIVIQLRYGGKKILLAGDATEDTEKYMLSRLNPETLESNILKVAHHGSYRTSNRLNWINRVNPEFAFISSNRDGTIDPHGENVTGQRNPQAITIDLIRGTSDRLFKQCEEHYYVASYQKKEWDEAQEECGGSLVKPNRKKDFFHKPELPFITNNMGEVGSDGWDQVRTKEAIFTTVAEMDMPGWRDNESRFQYDQGAQYELVVSSNGDIEVLTTHLPTKGSNEPVKLVSIDKKNA